jgi:cyclohexanone monooxygenase
MAAADILSNVNLDAGPQVQTNLAANFKKSEDPPATQVPFDPIALKERYIAERDQRLKHGGGITQ